MYKMMGKENDSCVGFLICKTIIPLISFVRFKLLLTPIEDRSTSHTSSPHNKRGLEAQVEKPSSVQFDFFLKESKEKHLQEEI